MDSAEAVERAARLLRELRAERGMSQRRLADDAKLSPAVVNRVERGRDARLSTWTKLFAGLGYDLRLDPIEFGEEVPDLIDDERADRIERQRLGLCAGKRRFY